MPQRRYEQTMIQPVRRGGNQAAVFFFSALSLKAFAAGLITDVIVALGRPEATGQDGDRTEWIDLGEAAKDMAHFVLAVVFVSLTVAVVSMADSDAGWAYTGLLLFVMFLADQTRILKQLSIIFTRR